MRSIGLSLLLAGMFLMSLSGLEKILVFVSFQGKVSDMTALRDLTPSGLWSITNFTFVGGLVVLVVGLGCLFHKPFKRSLIEGNQAYQERSKEHGD
ncbi:hypothetical protein BVG16_26945 [Paenibacillus selenitireducens]|uniref:Uncharacterized protein n=1 Tax=Paenibacillus selenitireducens TaxID=1324314 RepID=A0A1T2X1J1_9BACL|nr:hypothetical protein [Paenibacillus selenitireducens]OPA73730.1 hypothetical protein BVG16_26945 [Paenibacillus selenitireducens]